jgi:N-methylhydantoinase A/oxoprolinase/acetone carboxylase beta subunit
LAHTESVANGRAAIVGTRQIWVGNGSAVERLEVDVISAEALKPGHVIEGPALLDGSDTTIWVPARVRAVVDEHRTIDMKVLS